MAKIGLFVNFVILIGFCQATKFCEMLIAVDQPLMDNYYYGNLTNLTDSIRKHVDDLNAIYEQKILGDQLQFRVREIRILDFCHQEECKNEKFFLDEFGRTIQQTSEPVCLAHIFTYRDFPGGTQGLAMSPGACKLQLNSGKITNLENIGLTTIFNHGKTVTELQTSLTFAHEVSHNLNATHDVDEYGKEISGPLMGATLGKNVTISNLKISKKSKQDIRDFFTRVTKGVRYELFKTLQDYPGYITFTKEWSQDDQDRLKQGYQEINCFKAKLDYSNDDKHFLKLRKDLETQVNQTF